MPQPPANPIPAARRVIESLDANGDGVVDSSRHLIYGGASLWEVLEQIDLATNTTIMTHVYGLGIDDEVSYQYLDQDMLKDMWAHRDDLNSLTSITDSAGDVKERYEYGDYGKASFFDEAGLSLPGTSFNAQHLYTGRSMIVGTGLYDYRYRVMEPETGRFNQRDPLGYLDSMSAYAYVVNNPFRYTDPYGLSYWDDFVEGWNTVLDTLDGTLQEEATRNANNLTRMANINYRKARDRGDPCAEAMLRQGLDDAAQVMANAVGLADQVVDLLQQIVDEIVTAPIPGPGIPGGGKLMTKVHPHSQSPFHALTKALDSVGLKRGPGKLKRRRVQSRPGSRPKNGSGSRDRLEITGTGNNKSTVHIDKNGHRYNDGGAAVPPHAGNSWEHWPYNSPHNPNTNR